MKTAKTITALRLLAAALCLTVAALACGCGFDTYSGQQLENPKLTILGFIHAMQAEDFDRQAAEDAMEYVGNYSTMGFEKFTMVEDDPMEKALFDLLRNSYSVEFGGSDLDSVSSPYHSADMRVEGKRAYVDVAFTSLDLESMSVPLSEAVKTIGEERAYEGERFETEESALALIEEVFHTVFDVSDLSEYSVRRELTLELSYHDDGWKLNISDELYDALLGRPC